MSAQLEQARKALEGPIDFRGQRQAERYMQYSLISSAVVAFLVGFALQDLRLTLWIFAAGFVFTLLLVVPPWNMYRQYPLSWLPKQPINHEQGKKNQ